MAINAFGNEDFSAFFQGAQVGNIMAMRAERAQQLRSQQALEAVRERQLTAQAELLQQHAALYKQQAQKAADDELEAKSVLKASQDHYDFLTNDPNGPQLSDSEATPLVINAVSRVSPKVGDVLAQSYERTQRGVKATQEQNFKPFIQELQTPDGKTLQVLHKSPNQIQMLPNATAGGQVADEITDKSGNIVSYVVPGANGPRFFPAKTATPSLATKEEIKSVYGQINRLQEQFDGMKDKTFLGRENTEKAALGKRIEELKGKARELDSGAGAMKAVAPATGRVKVRDKAGKEYTVPASQLDEAVKQGYEPVKE